ncbi:hypothetical protein BGZ94_002715 [Podila epigama]|nr:hypothetical protein BGZ94_002715 [Podila epigama]
MLTRSRRYPKSRRALAIPEIRMLIGSFLDSTSLTVCCRVSKDWCSTFNPILYREVTVADDSVSSTTLTRNAKDITSITFVLPSGGIDPNLCLPNLRHQQTLKTVSVDMIWPNNLASEFWSALGGCLKLETFRAQGQLLYNDGEVETEEGPNWRVCTRVENLGVNPWDPDLDFAQVEKLLLTRLPEQELPDTSDALREVSNSTLEALPATWPYFCEVTLASPQMSDHELASVFNSVKTLLRLILADATFGIMAFNALKRHFSTVQYLDLRRTWKVTSSMIQEIMASCPHLEVFRAEELLASDVVHGRPWVCLKLKELTLDLKLDAIVGQQEQRLDIEARLGALKHVASVRLT